jgi:hypothetical protein
MGRRKAAHLVSGNQTGGSSPMKLKNICDRVCAIALFLSFTLHATAQSTPSPVARKELLDVRKQVWDGYFENNQTRLQELLSKDFVTINPGDDHWQTRDEFFAGARGEPDR